MTAEETNRLDAAIIQTILLMEEQFLYNRGKYTEFVGKPFCKKFTEAELVSIRSKYDRKCMELAFQLKGWYTSNNMYSNTVCFRRKMDVANDDVKLQLLVRDSEKNLHDYTHHAVEVYFNNDRFKVIDPLHYNEVIWLDRYLDMLCEANNCDRSGICYDIGMLVTSNISAPNLKMFNMLVYWMDKQYRIGSPQCFVLFDEFNKMPDYHKLCSDIVCYDFSKLLLEFDLYVTAKEFQDRWMYLYNKMITIWINQLAPMCMLGPVELEENQLSVHTTLFTYPYIVGRLADIGCVSREIITLFS